MEMLNFTPDMLGYGNVGYENSEYKTIKKKQEKKRERISIGVEREFDI